MRFPVGAFAASRDDFEIFSRGVKTMARERGDNPDGLQAIYARIINYAIAERPADRRSPRMSVGAISAPPGFRPAVTSRWPRRCWPAPITTAISSNTIPSAPGGFEPLRYVPKGSKIVVVGVITSKTGAIEKKDDIKRRLEEASKFVPLDQLALSPQCGFASTEEGNVLTEEEQWAKLKLVVDVANEIWGR
jgi:5-methyltetrahydropteroyltriglutamate--homocysteine methyltransferase